MASSAEKISSSMGYIVDRTPPTGAQFIELRGVSGLTRPPVSAFTADAALVNSVLTLVARATEPNTEANVDFNDPIGMVRLIGDGYIFLHVTDMCVLPAYRGRGIASKLLDEMLAWIEENAPNASVSMIGDPPAQSMYGKKGFKKPSGIGMVRSNWGR